jgi:hypothetical protein
MSGRFGGSRALRIPADQLSELERNGDDEGHDGGEYGHGPLAIANDRC